MVIIMVILWNKKSEIMDVSGVGKNLARNIFILITKLSKP